MERTEKGHCGRGLCNTQRCSQKFKPDGKEALRFPEQGFLKAAERHAMTERNWTDPVACTANIYAGLPPSSRDTSTCCQKEKWCEEDVK